MTGTAYESGEEVWTRFTGRRVGARDLGSAREAVRGRRILITGAGGSIGSALARAVAAMDPGELVLLDVAETGLYELGCDEVFGRLGSRASFVVGSIGDEALVAECFGRHRPQIVFHAAACKHVPLMEANPFTAAATNALGTERMVRACGEYGVEAFVLLSTDKAVEPLSIMGATKRVAELILLAQRGSTKMKALRLGNVFGSSGSVAPRFQEQIRRGGPVTVTDPDATRYFVPISEAVACLLSTLAVNVPRGVLLADVGEPQRILALAKFLIEEDGGRVEVVFTGLRPGDKLSERLVAEDEVLSTEATNGLRSVIKAGALPVLGDCLEAIGEAIEKRDLNALLGAIQSVVPEYRPSEVLERERIGLQRSVPA